MRVRGTSLTAMLLPSQPHSGLSGYSGSWTLIVMGSCNCKRVSKAGSGETGELTNRVHRQPLLLGVVRAVDTLRYAQPLGRGLVVGPVVGWSAGARAGSGGQRPAKVRHAWS